MVILNVLNINPNSEVNKGRVVTNKKVLTSKKLYQNYIYTYNLRIHGLKIYPNH